MTGTPQPAARQHDFAVGYVERDLGETGAAFTQRLVEDGRTVRVEGHCPGCAGHMAVDYPRGAPGSGTKGLLRRIAGGRAPAPVRVPDVLAAEVLFCECGYAHPGQPPDAVFLGCGASWRVRGTSA